MTIIFYRNDKRSNSTKQPQSSTQFPAVSKTATLKDDCNNLRPQFDLLLDSVTQDPGYNYIEWNETPTLRRYYFITERTYLSNSHIRISCEEDVLATYKAFIQSESHFVTRSSQLRNQYITDTLYPTAQNKISNLDSFTVGDYTDGFYVIGVIHQIGPGSAGDGYSFSRGSVYYYTAKQSEFETLLQFLNAPGAAYSDYNPLSHIVSCIYIPDDETGSSVTSAMFVHGGDSFNWTHTKISIGASGLHHVPISSRNLPDHTQHDGARLYLNYAPFSKYTLFAPPFGQFEIDRSLMGAFTNKAITFTLSVDCADGTASLIVTGGSRRLIQTSGNYAVNVMLAQQTTRSGADLMRLDNMETAATLAGLAGASAAAMRKDVGGLAGSAINAINAANDYTLASYLTNIPKVSVLSSNGAMSILSKSWGIQSEFAQVSGEDVLEMGAPYMAYTSLASVSGYVQCMNARYQGLAGTKEERDAIDAFLNSGFYIQ